MARKNKKIKEDSNGDTNNYDTTNEPINRENVLSANTPLKNKKKRNNIEDYITELGDRFLGMYINDLPDGNSGNHKCHRLEINFYSQTDDKYLIFGYPSQENFDEQIIKTVHKSDNVYHIFSFDANVGFVELFEHVLRIIADNENTHKKNKLIKEKFKELGELCLRLSYDELKKIKLG